MSTVCVDLLGPLDLRVGDGPVPVRGQRQRTILAVLALAPGRTVPVDTLIEAVWADAPPASARTQVAICVAGLRKAIEAAGADRDVITTEAPGYRLCVDPGRIDVGRFVAARTAALAAADRGDVTSAVGLLGDALALWRGTALGEMPSHPLEMEAERLEEQRLGAVEQWARWCLDLGRHAEVLTPLVTVIADHPLREQAQGMLMLARYRCGLRADALNTFREARRVSVDETGLEPGPLLQRMHDAILADDPGLRPDTGPDPVPAAPRGPVAGRLPIGPISFAGRATELRRLDEMVAGHSSGPGGPLVAYLSGAPGIGKTALALHWAAGMVDRFPDGQIAVDLADPGTDPVTHCLAALGVTGSAVPDRPAQRLALYRSLIADRRVLLLLDGARSTTQVTDLLPAGSGSLVLVTGREVLYGLLGGNCSAHLPLGPLSTGEARLLLGAIAGAHRVAAEPEQADRLVELCDRLPLALRNVGARLSARPRWTLAHLVERVADESRRLDELSTAEHDLRELMARACDSLTDTETSLLRCLGVRHRDRVSVPECADLLQTTPVRAERAMERLVDLSLAEPAGGEQRVPSTYRIGGLVRTWVRELGAVAAAS